MAGRDEESRSFNDSVIHPMNGPMTGIVCCCSQAPTLQTMKRILLVATFTASFLSCLAAALGQSGPVASAGLPAQSKEPVSYASVTQLNGFLAQLEATSKNTQADLVKLRIDRWKTSNAAKKDALAAVDSIQRDLQDTLPDVISQLRAAPEDLPSTSNSTAISRPCVTWSGPWRKAQRNSEPRRTTGADE